MRITWLAVALQLSESLAWCMPGKRGPPATPEEPPKKRARPDRSARIQAAKSQKVRAIRVKLNGLLTRLGARLHWRDFVKQATKAWWHAHRLSNEVVAQHTADGRAVPPLNEAFFYDCLAAVDKNWHGKKLKPDSTEAEKEAHRVFVECADKHREICLSGEDGLPDLHLLSGFKLTASLYGSD